jgi:hypothetical protein
MPAIREILSHASRATGYRVQAGELEEVEGMLIETLVASGVFLIVVHNVNRLTIYMVKEIAIGAAKLVVFATKSLTSVVTSRGSRSEGAIALP